MDGAGVGRAKKTRRRRAWALACLVLAVAWFGGLIGRFTACVLLPRALPLRPGGGIEVSRLTCAGLPALDGNRAMLISSALRLRAMVRELTRFHWLLPPGLLRHGMAASGVWRPGAGETAVPFMVVTDDHAGDRLLLRLRYPVAPVNRLLAEEYGDSLTSREEWFLGTYDLRYELRFDTLRVRSRDDADGTAALRRFDLEATGRIRLYFEDNLLDARTTARARLAGTVEVTVIRDAGGIGLSYEVKLDRLDANFHNVAPWGDERISDLLRRSLEKSLNRGRSRKRLKERRFPAWLPVDADMDVLLSSEPG